MSELSFFGNYDVKETEKPMIPPNYINININSKKLINTQPVLGVYLTTGSPLTITYSVTQNGITEDGHLQDMVIGRRLPDIYHISTNFTNNDPIKLVFDGIIYGNKYTGMVNLTGNLSFYNNDGTTLVTIDDGILPCQITDNISNTIIPELNLTLEITK